MKSGSRRLSLAITAFVLTLAGTPLAVGAQTRTVNCPGGSVGQALRLPSIRPLTIIVQGTCHENITIQRDDVTIQAGAGGASIVSSTLAGTTKDVVTIDGAKRVVLIGLTISGGLNGVVGRNGAHFGVLGSTVQGNLQNGIVATLGSTVAIDSTGTGATAVPTTVSNNGSGTGSDPARGQHGLVVGDNSSAVVMNSTFTGNARNGITILRSSSARIGINPAAVAGPNTISGNTLSGISVFQSSQALIHGNTIQTNGGSGISVDSASSASIVLNLIQSNSRTGITVTNSSGARIGLDDRNQAPQRADGFTNTIRSNGSDGVAISQGANANLYGNLIELNSARGVTVARAAGQSFGNNTIQNNVQDGLGVFTSQFFQGAGLGLTPFRDLITGNGTGGDPNRGWGVTSFDHSGVRLENVEISGNHNDGILVGDSSNLDIRSTDPSNPSVIKNNGTVPYNISPFGSKPPFNNLFGFGINVFNGSSADVRGVQITTNKSSGIVVSDKSVVQVRSHAVLVGTTPTPVFSTISGNAVHGISCFNGSTVNVSRNATITGNGTPGTGPGFPVGNGINAFLGCAVAVSASTISSNAANGIVISQNSTAQLFTPSVDNPPFDGFFTGFTLDTVVSGNALDGVGVFSNSSLSMSGAGGALTAAAPPSVTGNGRFGINCSGQSIVPANLTNVTGNTGGTVGGTPGHQTNPDPLTFLCP